jgi:rSAM/selenodomain-associated transferase 1
MGAHTRLDPLKPNQIPEGLCAFGIMTKAPEPGKVKTRLTPPLTPEESARLNQCFLQDLARSIDQAAMMFPARGVGVYTPAGAELAYRGILPADFFLLAQRGDGFGERLIFAAHDLFKTGFASVCLINSDSPTVEASSFAEAARVLAEPGDRVVLGPSDDGGYYLIGLKALHRRLFAEIDWSTEKVFEQTMARANELGLEIHSLPNGFDVDDRATLQRLCQELLEKDARPDKAPNTRKFLEEIIDREGRDRIWPVM